MRENTSDSSNLAFSQLAGPIISDDARPSHARGSYYELAVIIPTLNERENVPILLGKLRESLRGVRYEAIIVDDDSPDGTASLIKRTAEINPDVRVLHRIGRRGLASACIEGMLSTAAPYIAVIDADLQHDETILPEMLRLISSERLDVVVGSRNIEGGSMGDFASWRVRLSSAGRKFSGLGEQGALTDPMSGFFMVRRSFFDPLAHRLTGKGFKILLDIVLSADGIARIGEVPYHFRVRQHGQSKLDIMVGLEYLELLLDKMVGSWISVRFVLFCAIGTVGVGVHLLLLWGLLSSHAATFLQAQAVATLVVMMLNYMLNNAVTYRDRRRRGLSFWLGLVKFCAACALGAVANLAISTEAFQHGIPWLLAGLTGLLFSAVWNFGVTSALIWRHGKKSAASRAERRAEAEAYIQEHVATARRAA